MCLACSLLIEEPEEIDAEAEAEFIEASVPESTNDSDDDSDDDFAVEESDDDDDAEPIRTTGRSYSRYDESRTTTD